MNKLFSVFVIYQCLVLNLEFRDGGTPPPITIGCTAIKSHKDLQNVLKKVSGVDTDRMCVDLKIATGTCNTLEKKNVFTLSREFMEQDPDHHCWEFIIQVLCEDFEKSALARKVQRKYNVSEDIYKHFCSFVAGKNLRYRNFIVLVVALVAIIVLMCMIFA